MTFFGDIFSDNYRTENTYPNFFCRVLFSSDTILVTRQLLIDTKDFCATTSVENHDFLNVKNAVETAIMNIIEDVDTNNVDEEERQKKRVWQETPNYWDSTWGRMLLDSNFADSDSFAAKKFRRRFRVP